MIFLDSNILIDLIEPDAKWTPWTRATISVVAASGPLSTGTVVIAETAARFGSLEAQLGYLAALGIDVHLLDANAARRAGRAHQAYRRAGGERVGILADFLIGGHAVALGATLLTRDRQRFASYFPDLPLITPETHP